MLGEDRTCEYCGAVWPMGSITYNSYQCMRSKCKVHGVKCLGTSTYLKVTGARQ